MIIDVVIHAKRSFNQMSEQIESISLEAIMQGARNDLAFDMTNAEKVSMKIPGLFEKYGRIMIMSKAAMKKAEMDLAKSYAERTNYYMTSHPLRIDRRDLDVFIKGDQEYIKIQSILETKKLQVEYIQIILNALGSSSFNINNAVKLHVWKEGGR